MHLKHDPGVGLIALAVDLGAVSLKFIGGKLAPELVYSVPRKELLSFSEMVP